LIRLLVQGQPSQFVSGVGGSTEDLALDGSEPSPHEVLYEQRRQQRWEAGHTRRATAAAPLGLAALPRVLTHHEITIQGDGQGSGTPTSRFHNCT
jgi:hypothetical protein